MFSATQIFVTHDAVCPEISPVHCAEPGGLPFHTHHQGMQLARLNGLVAVGLGKGLQVKGELPLDRKKMTIEYKDKDGKAYDPPYQNIHHRNEVLMGPGDGRLHLEYFHSVGKTWTLGGSTGATIPLGKTEVDPYELTEKSLSHQHIQMGSGVVSPVASLRVIQQGHRWGMMASAQGLMSLYHNDKNYKPSSSMTLSAGPTFRITSKVMLFGSVEVLKETQAFWGEDADPMSGRTAIIGSGGVVYRFNPTVALMAQGRGTMAQWSTADLITQHFIGVAGVTFTPQKD